MIGKLYHLAHIVHDVDATDRLYFDVFDCLRPYRAFDKTGRRDASLAIISDQCMEPIHPSDNPADAHTPLARFRARFGNRMHSIAWYANDLKGITRRLLEHDIRLYGIDGRPVTDPDKGIAVWTHPSDTGTMLEFAEPGYAADPRLHRTYSTDRWRDHPLALICTSHVTVLVDDLGDADRLYGAALDGLRFHTDDSATTTPRAYYAIGESTVIEAVAPTSTDTPEGADHAMAGNLVHAVTFATADLNGACAFLADHNISVTRARPGHVWLELDPEHGVRIGLTDVALPGDPRSSTKV